MLFCIQEAILYIQGKDPICPNYRPRWWPKADTKIGDGLVQPQIRAPLVGGWFEGHRTGAASLLPWQIRHNLFGRGGGCGGKRVKYGEVLVEDSRVRADGTRVPHMMVVPLEAFRLRYSTY